MASTHKLSIRLLREKVEPEQSVNAGVPLGLRHEMSGYEIQRAKDIIPGRQPGWKKLLGETTANDAVINGSQYSLFFVHVDTRWLVISFGRGHDKLRLGAVELDFGMRVVLNMVDPDKLRSMDVRKLDDHDTSVRKQTGRCSDQVAFSVDFGVDIMRGLAGKPRVNTFAKFIAGSDSLVLTKKVVCEDLPKICAEVLDAFRQKTYRKNFGWIDQIYHVRDRPTLESLDGKLVAALTKSLKGYIPETLRLGYPVIYDPENLPDIRYMGFYSKGSHSQIDIDDYIQDMRDKELKAYKSSYLASHVVCEVVGQGNSKGQRWRIKDCFVFETKLKRETYVLKTGHWYKIDKTLVDEVSADFDKIPDYGGLPPARANETEPMYNARIAEENEDMLLLDRRLVKPKGAFTRIEFSDILKKQGTMIHIKNGTKSAQLSHLFYQGVVAARSMQDPTFRDNVNQRIEEQKILSQRKDFRTPVASSTESYHARKHLIVYAVMSHHERLPFFSLVALKLATTELRKLGHRCAFAWIEQPPPTKVDAEQKTRNGKRKASDDCSSTNVAKSRKSNNNKSLNIAAKQNDNTTTPPRAGTQRNTPAADSAYVQPYASLQEFKYPKTESV